MLHWWTWRVSFSSGLIRQYSIQRFTRIEAYDRALDLALEENAGNIINCYLTSVDHHSKNGK